jgi:hypothetical protein
MAKKEKIELQRSEDFASLETELSAAMQDLDNANERITALLEEYQPAIEPVVDMDERADNDKRDGDAPPDTP